MAGYTWLFSTWRVGLNTHIQKAILLSYKVQSGLTCFLTPWITEIRRPGASESTPSPRIGQCLCLRDCMYTENLRNNISKANKACNQADVTLVRLSKPKKTPYSSLIKDLYQKSILMLKCKGSLHRLNCKRHHGSREDPVMQPAAMLENSKGPLLTIYRNKMIDS